jgi:mannose-1-phosphate guanylyltransferase
MRAVVLVGGFGTRLRPLTDTIPKPMLAIGHVPLVARLVGRLEAGGVDAVTLALGFRPGPFVDAFPDSRCGGVTLSYAVEPEPLDTGGAIRFAAEQAGIADTFVVANGDVLTDLDVGALIDRHRDAGAAATLHLTGVDDPSAYGVAELDRDGRVLQFVEKPPPGTEPSNLISAGTYVFEPRVLERIPSGRPVSIERETFPLLVADRTLFGMVTADYWIDCGRPEQFLQANLDLLNGARLERITGVHPDASIDADVTVTQSVIGPGAAVAAGAEVVGSVILPGAVVGAGSSVTDSIVMGSVGAGARLLRVVVGGGAEVADGRSIVDARIPEPAP